MLLCARLVTGLCVVLLLGAAVFDSQAERVTSGTVPAELAARMSGGPIGLGAPLLVVGHNLGDDLGTAEDGVTHGVGAVEIDVRDVDGTLSAAHDRPLPVLGDIGFRRPSLSRSWQIAALRPTVLLHLKDHSDGFVARVAQFLAQRPPRRLVIQASSVATLASVRRRIPQAERLLLIFDAGALASVRRSTTGDGVVAGLSVRQSLLTPGVQEWVRRRGLRLFAWTVNDAPRLGELTAHGLDGVMTDSLDLMRRAAEGRQ